MSRVPTDSLHLSSATVTLRFLSVKASTVTPMALALGPFKPSASSAVCRETLAMHTGSRLEGNLRVCNCDDSCCMSICEQKDEKTSIKAENCGRGQRRRRVRGRGFRNEAVNEQVMVSKTGCSAFLAVELTPVRRRSTCGAESG